MKVGIIGQSGSGRSTIFAALSGLDITQRAASMGTFVVPDTRFEGLVQAIKPAKETPIQITVEDLFTSGEAKEKLEERHYGKMRNMDVLVYVVGMYAKDAESAKKEIASFHEDLCLSDYSICTNRIERLKKENKPGRDVEVLTKIANGLEENKPLRLMELDEQEHKMIAGYRFLTQLPLCMVVNRGEDQSDSLLEFLKQWGDEHHAAWMELCAKLEMEVALLPEEDRGDFLAELGMEREAKHELARKIFELLDYITFYTAGPKEVHAWNVRRGTNAVRAAGKIHSDIERGFIRAEVMDADELIEVGDEKKVNKRLEGKEYVVKDGDTVYFRFNV